MHMHRWPSVEFYLVFYSSKLCLSVSLFSVLFLPHDTAMVAQSWEL